MARFKRLVDLNSEFRIQNEILNEVIKLKRGAIFDMDGTLFDTEKLYRRAWIETADIFGVERKPEIAAMMSGGTMGKFLDVLPEYFPTVNAIEYVNHVLQRAKNDIENNLEMKPGVVEILTYCRENNISTAIASSSEKNAIIKNIRRAGIEKFFDAIVGGDQITNGKPAPDIFLLAAKKINLPPNDCYAFEDSLNGIRSAAAANCAAIMVIDQVIPPPDVRELCARVFNSLNEALDWIKK